MPASRTLHAVQALTLATALWPLAAPALELDDVAREGELRFLAVRPDPGAYWYESQVRIDPESLDTGLVNLLTCHHALDPNRRIVVAFNPRRVQQIDITSTDGVGRAWVEGHRVELADVRRGGKVCIHLRSRALERIEGSGRWRLYAGPLMRRYLDGYLPMQARLAFQWPAGLLRVAATEPPSQPGVQVDARKDGLSMDIVFAGRMSATVELERPAP
jgi:hypothetical protein